MLEEIALILGATTIAPVLLLQFVPVRYTVTKGTLVTIETWRGTVWALPTHMLSSFGKTLRYSVFVLLAVDGIAILFACIAEKI